MEAEQRKNQKITLKEYLPDCHYHLYNKFVLADDSKFATGFISVEGKYYPKWLRPWNSSTKTQLQYHFKAFEMLYGKIRFFNQELATKIRGIENCSGLAADLFTVCDRLTTIADERSTSLRHRPLRTRLQIPSQTLSRCRQIRIPDAQIYP